jgi:hypothetical protein
MADSRALGVTEWDYGELYNITIFCNKIWDSQPTYLVFYIL